MTILPNRKLDTVAAAPVFIVGVPRSGTTWLQRMILSHPRVCGGQESHFFCTFAPAIELFYPDTLGIRAVGLPNYWTKAAFWEELRGLWRRTMSPVIEAKSSATILLEKTPLHARHMNAILDVFPEGRFIHIIRDSRAVVASMLAASRVNFGKHWAPASAFNACRMWKSTVLLANRAGDSLPAGRYMRLHYEQLYASPVEEILRVFKFIGLDLSTDEAEQIVTEHEFARQKKIGGSPIPAPGKGTDKTTDADAAIRKGIPDSWRKDLTYWQQLVVWLYTRNVMKRLGYSRTGWNPKSDDRDIRTAEHAHDGAARAQVSS
jgi:hypothetical protein